MDIKVFAAGLLVPEGAVALSGGSREHLRAADATTANNCFGGAAMGDAWPTLSSQRVRPTRWPGPGRAQIHRNGG